MYKCINKKRLSQKVKSWHQPGVFFCPHKANAESTYLVAKLIFENLLRIFKHLLPSIFTNSVHWQHLSFSWEIKKNFLIVDWKQADTANLGFKTLENYICGKPTWFQILSYSEQEPSSQRELICILRCNWLHLSTRIRTEELLIIKGAPYHLGRSNVMRNMYEAYGQVRVINSCHSWSLSCWFITWKSRVCW